MATAIIRRGDKVVRVQAISVRGPGAEGSAIPIGDPTSGDYSAGGVPTLTAETTVADAIQAINEALITEDRVGFLLIADVEPQNPEDAVSDKVFVDSGNTVIESCTSSSIDVLLSVEASYPKVLAKGLEFELSKTGEIYSGTIALTLDGSEDVVVAAIDPDGGPGAEDTVSIEVDLPPALLTLAFTGGYPGVQTELKAGDIFELTGTTDKPADAVEVEDFGASDSVQLLTFIDGTSFTVSMVIGDRGISLQDLPARARARSATTGGFGPARDTNQDGGSVDGVDTVKLNNLYPTVSLGAVSYPVGQQALKGAESATVLASISDADSVLFDSPTFELDITDPSVIEAVKTVTRVSGSYNVSTDNLRATATRAANAATSQDALVVQIANVAAVISVLTPAARLRSGGNDGTTAQDHIITISSDQELLAAPSMNPGAGSAGTFQGAGFAGGPSNWTRALRVHDDDDKGSKSWQNLSATNLAGLATSTISNGATYELGGFVARSLTFAAFATQTAMDVSVVDFAKLQAGVFTATNQTALKQPIGTAPPVENGYTIDALLAKPTQVVWLDSSAAASNSGGTAQITNVEELA